MNVVLTNYPHIREAIEVKPDIEKYIKIIEEQSQMVANDLASLEYILTYHTIEQTYNFMPRFISFLN
jgi:hypothetical protein